MHERLALPPDPRPADRAARIGELRTALLEAQAEIREREIPALVLVAGDDRWGCSEVLDRLHHWLDPARLDTVVRLPVTEDDRERPFMWRAWRDLPARGRIGLVYGGWPHRLVLDRLRGRISDREMDQGLRAVRDFDRALAAAGTIRVRFWVHVRRDEHVRRFESARRDPEWRWRLDATDRAILERWDEVVPLGERCVEATDGPHAPWRIIDGGDRDDRDLVVAESLLAALRAGLEDTVPSAPPDLRSADAEMAPPFPSRLADVDHDAHLPREPYHERRAVLQPRLARRMRQFAESGQSAVLVIEGPDAAGKGGAIRRVTDPLPATMERVVRIGAPTDVEAARHYLWRFWRHLPPAGHLLVFDRSWYGRVLVERVEGLAPEDAWRRAYDEINAFERQLVESGVALVKCWLHISKDEQARRFESRQKTGWKRHKITDADWRARDHWDEYEAAANEMFERTSTKAAPWTVIPADCKRFARIEVLDTLTKTLKRSLWRDRRERRRR